MMVRGVVREMMMRAGMVLAGAGMAGPVTAQQPVGYAAHSISDVRVVQAAAPTVKMISVNFRDTPVRKAVEAIIEQSGVTVFYSSDMLPDKMRVTFTGKQITAEVALKGVLERTDLYVQRMPGGEFRVVRVPASQVADGVITGKVLNARTRQPIEGVVVAVDGIKQEAKTGPDGAFRMQVPSGEYTVRVRGLGFIRQNKTVTVKEDETIRVEVALEPSASVLDEVVVTGTVAATERKAITSPITVITAKQMEERGITRIDQLFRGEIPGVVSLETGTLKYNVDNNVNREDMVTPAYVHARGSADLRGGATPLKTYVDGVELVDPGYVTMIDPQSVERIEIITGPQAATIYGSGAIGGVMQIFTKKGSGSTAPSVVANFKYGMLESNLSGSITPSHQQAVNLTGGRGVALSYAVSGSHEYTGQWQPNLFDRAYGGALGLSLVQGPFTASGSFSARSTRTGQLGTPGVTPEFGYAGGRAASPIAQALELTGEIVYPTYVFPSSQVSEGVTRTVAVNIDAKQRSALQYHLTIGRSETDTRLDKPFPLFNYPGDSNVAKQRAERRRTTIDLNTTMQSQKHVVASTLTLGFTGAFGEGLRISANNVPFGGQTTYYSSNVYPSTSKSWGGLASWQVGFWNQAFITMGVRGERNSYYGLERPVDWTPTVGVAYAMVGEELSVKVMGSYGIATKPPTPNMREEVLNISDRYDPAVVTYVHENQMIRPERSQGPQIGLELYYGSMGSFTLNYYRQTVTDLLQYVQVDTVRRTDIVCTVCQTTLWAESQWQNTAKIRNIGWEGTGSLTVGSMSVKGTYSWNDGRVLSLNPGAYSELGIYNPNAVRYQPGDVFTNVPSHTGNLVFGYAYRGTSASLVMNYIGAGLRQIDGDGDWPLRQMARLKQYTDTRRAAPPNPGRSASYVKSDFTASHRITNWASFRIDVRNLGDSYASDLGGFLPSLGRQTNLGLSVRYP